jgi:hypothetical protein
MTYNDAENLASTHSGIIGKPLLNKLVFLDNRKITSLLVSSREKIKEVFTAWWYNGNDNEKAIVKNKKDTNFEVFLMSYNPSAHSIIYYLRLSKYIELANNV